MVTGGGVAIGVVAGLLTGTGELAGFVGVIGLGTGVVEGTVTGIAAGLEGEIVTGFVAGTVMIVGVSGGVMIGVDDAGFVGKTVFVGLVVSSRLLLLSFLLAKSFAECTSIYNAAILFLIWVSDSRYLDIFSLNWANSIEGRITVLFIVRTMGASLQGRMEAARVARLMIAWTKWPPMLNSPPMLSSTMTKDFVSFINERILRILFSYDAFNFSMNESGYATEIFTSLPKWSSLRTEPIDFKACKNKGISFCAKHSLPQLAMMLLMFECERMLSRWAFSSEGFEIMKFSTWLLFK